MSQPKERGVFIGKRPRKDGLVKVCILARDGSVVLKGFAHAGSIGPEERWLMCQLLEKHDTVVRLSA